MCTERMDKTRRKDSAMNLLVQDFFHQHYGLYTVYIYIYKSSEGKQRDEQINTHLCIYVNPYVIYVNIQYMYKSGIFMKGLLSGCHSSTSVQSTRILWPWMLKCKWHGASIFLICVSLGLTLDPPLPAPPLSEISHWAPQPYIFRSCHIAAWTMLEIPTFVPCTLGHRRDKISFCKGFWPHPMFHVAFLSSHSGPTQQPRVLWWLLP